MFEESRIVGRYAPSPTGELHMGNLRTAILAWLHARLQGGKFIVRMEDIDLPRVVSGSADQILRDLEWLGINWDGEVVYQSDRQALYKHALAQLETAGLVYPCFCSRKDIRNACSAPQSDRSEISSEMIYPGTCSDLSSQQIEQRKELKSPAYRLKVNACLAKQCGDFVVKRADELYAYQLVVVVDDLDQGVTHVVRGADLASSTARQQYLAGLLKPDREKTSYYHAPLMLDLHGKRMAKRDGSMSITAWRESTKLDSAALVAELLQSLDLIDEASISLDDALTVLSVDDIESCLHC